MHAFSTKRVNIGIRRKGGHLKVHFLPLSSAYMLVLKMETPIPSVPRGVKARLLSPVACLVVGELGAGAGKQLDSALVRGVVSGGEANPASREQRLGPLLTISREANLGLPEHRIEEHLGRGGKAQPRGKSSRCHRRTTSRHSGPAEED